MSIDFGRYTKGINYFLVFYFGFGLLVAILAMIGFLFRND